MHFFDLQHTLLAKHAQHIVLVHFPIALVFVALFFDLLALRQSDRGWSAVAYYNLSVAAAAVLPVVITGVIAWQWQLEGSPLKGALRLHLLFAVTSTVMIVATWIAARRTREAGSRVRLAMEFATVAVVAITAHLGGVVAGVAN